jgi:hypothetical protein
MSRLLLKRKRTSISILPGVLKLGVIFQIHPGSNLMAKKRNRDENRKFWQMAIEMQRESGLSIAEFCRREGLQAAMYYAWRRKLKQNGDPNADRTAGSGQGDVPFVVKTESRSHF